MELSPKQQVTERVNKAQKILLLTHKNPDGDALGGLLAMHSFLSKRGKEVMAVCNDVVPDVFSFLPNYDKISQNFAGNRDFVISVDIGKIKADKIMYKVKEDKLNIIITPEKGEFTKDMISFDKGGSNFDLIIVLDCTDLERIGSPYEKNADLFYSTPIINIDHHAGNDYFGQVNLVELTATSTCEILVSILEALSPNKSPFDEEIATMLLTGIITDTGSFQNANTTPKSLTISAQLVASGAHREEIIKKIYKTRALSTLRLWGKVLANIHDEKGDGFVWSSLSKDEFIQAGAKIDEASGVIDELLKTVSGVDFVLLLTERNSDGKKVHGSLRSVKKGVDVSEVAKIFGGGGHAMAAAFELTDTTLAESTQMIVQRIREKRKETNNS